MGLLLPPPPPPETSVADLLKRLRVSIGRDAGSSCLRQLAPMYQRLLSPREDTSNSVQRELLDVRAKLLSCGPRAVVSSVVDRMDEVVERCWSIEEQQTEQRCSGEGAAPIGEVMRLLVALAGGDNGETFVLEDPMQVFYATGKKRIGDCIRMNDIKIVQCANALFSKAPASLDENALFSQSLFDDFGNGISSQHASLWCTDSGDLEDKGFSDMMPSQQPARFFGLPGTPPAQITFDCDLMQSRASACMKSEGRKDSLPPKNGVFFYDSTQEIHCGKTEKQADWGSATETSSWDSDSSLDTTEPWVARTYAWEDLGDRVGLPASYLRPPARNVTWSLRDLVIPNNFAGKNDAGETLLEIHEVDMIEDLLRALSGVDSTILRRHFESATFRLPEKHRLKLRNATVSSTLSLMEVFRKAGTTVMRLELLGIYYSQDPARGGKTLQAIGDALQLYLATHRALVEGIAHECLVSSEIVSVAKLLSKTSMMCRTLATIGHVFGCDDDVFWPLLQQGTFPRGVALLDHLHHHVSSLRVEDATGHIHNLVTWFLVKACSPLLAVLSDLISLGKVDQMTDPFDEFDVTTWSRLLLEKAAVQGGDGLFSDELTSEAVQTLPAFLKNIAPLVVHLSQVQALLRSVNAIASTHPLVNMQPLTFFFDSNKATEHAEKWQSAINEAVSFRKDDGTLHAVSTETRRTMSDVTRVAAEELLEQSIDIPEQRSSQLQQTSMSDEQMLEEKRHHFRSPHELNANDAKQVGSVDEAGASQAVHVHAACLDGDAGNRSAIDCTGAASARASAFSGDEDRMSFAAMGSTDGGVWRASVKPNMTLTSCSTNSAIGGAPRESVSVDDGTHCAAANDVKMVLSNLAVDEAEDSMAKDLLLEDTVGEGVQQQNAIGSRKNAMSRTSELDDKLLLDASEYVATFVANAARPSLPPVHPFFSAAIPRDDLEVLMRASTTQDTPEADFTSFSSIVSCCVETPVRLVAHKLEQVAVDWFRDSLQVLEHLRWLRKLMLMAEGLCMDIFARDFLLGLSPARRVDWGVEDRLSSALTLAMIEGCVPTDAMAQNFHYKSTPLLSQFLSSLTMTPAVASLVGEIELIYDVSWPLGLVITARSLSDYKQVHQFLLHLRLTSLELKEAWRILRSIRQQGQLPSALERLCSNAVYRMQAFLRAFHEAFATKAITVAWAELERLSQKATTLVDLRRCHEEYVSVARYCCFLDAPVVEIRSAISAALAAAWKLTAFLRGLERQTSGRVAVETPTRALCDALDTTLDALVGGLRSVSRHAEQNTREFSDCLLLRLDFNQYYSTDTPVINSSSSSAGQADAHRS
ncbi:unnamed protein product [Hyaloperonospora brassicae]|uniref:Spindle pole body component n=1 Tax=Hyaloperonospora brassicae TaxID=162125 RepID=A0AAV0T7R1_HYABA|nr:unnamed protein product [Hyaloperonospora brassicae]